MAMAKITAMLVLASGTLLAGCTTAPIGKSPALRGTYLEDALVTNPDGGGPQVVIWGPPQNYNPSAQE